MSTDQKRKRFDPAEIARTMAALTGISDAPEPKAIPKLHALKVIDLAHAALGNSGATWQEEGPFRRVSIQINDDAFITYREPFLGGTFGPDYKLEIIEGHATVFSAKWYNDEGADRFVYCFQPGKWLASLAEMPNRESADL